MIMGNLYLIWLTVMQVYVSKTLTVTKIYLPRLRRGGRIRLSMQHFIRWIGRRFKTFDLLPEYFTAATQQMQNILWGALLPFVAWGIWFVVSNPPMWIKHYGRRRGVVSRWILRMACGSCALRSEIDIALICSREWTILQGIAGAGHHAKAYYLEVVNRSEGLTIERCQCSVE
jgi:hypothetical protein